MSSPSALKLGSENSGLPNPVHITEGLSQIENGLSVLFRWNIKDFSKISSTNISIFSPEFDGGELSRVKWCLKLNTKEKVGEKEHIGVYLRLSKSQNIEENDGINVYFEMTLHLNGTIKKSKETNHKFSNNDDNWGWPKIMKTSTIKSDQIKIECKMTLRNTSKLIHKIIVSPIDQSNDNFEKFRSDFLKILQSKEHSDFEIQVQDETFKVHKAILSARSGVFSAMFSTPMQESVNSSVKIEDFNEKIVKNMLEFIYRGKTDIFESNVQELLKIADKYDLPDLKTDCEKYLIAHILNKEKCVLLLELADCVNASKLKAEAINLIVNFKNKVSQSALFQNLMKSNGPIAGEILMAEWQNGGMEMKVKTTKSEASFKKRILKNCTSCTIA